MNKKLTLEEKKEANRLKQEFVKLHSQISHIQIEIKNLNERAEELIEELKSLRTEESDFLNVLKEKHGEGSLDPFTLIYKIMEKENETNR